ncbi:LRR receptor-like serine/threonine-protein kinase ERECTA [Salvia hispanica]|uniref:LRR receptor-like serine/threonine-protein kinase ERECTA n=1 Tax=Salvia hispanica TaxID=49212 RepID=UPI0020096D72|nr:LRR receptor-like serine/threonine-protein kinase ERECTA [Salvia hispanica]
MSDSESETPHNNRSITLSAKQFAEFMRLNVSQKTSNHQPSSLESIGEVRLTDKLNGDNYHLWVKLMRRAIGGKGLASHISGVTDPPPPTDPHFDRWQQRDDCCFNWIISNIDASLVNEPSRLCRLPSLRITSSSSPFSNSNTDQDALLTFKNAINLESDSMLNKNWSTNASICSWTGVSCSLDHQRVTALNFSGFLLHGTISPHLGNLTFLQSLDLSSNNFTGSIPSELYNIQRLKTLNLSSNQLVGGLPSGIFTNMSVLVEINLRFNNLSGELPSDICSNTPKLKRLLLSGNKIVGKIPKSIWKCVEMEDLRISSNKITANIPTEIGNLTKLTFLSMFSNHLEGEIPSSVFNISSLEIVYLSDNILSSSVPIFNSLTRLQLLYLDSNYLTGGIPKEIGYLTSLQHLKLNKNNLTE